MVRALLSLERTPITNMATKRTLEKAQPAMIPKGPRPKALLKKERGVWVYQGEPTGVSITALIERTRLPANRKH
jgi:hypothetical protein